jgi:hypothetical protein
MTLEGVPEDDGALKGIVETIENKGAPRFKGGLRHVTKVGVVVISGLESSKSRGLQARSRGDLNPLDEVKDGGYIVEFGTNNKRGDNLGF